MKHLQKSIILIFLAASFGLYAQSNTAEILGYLRTSLTNYPSEVVYEEEGAQAPRHIEYKISASVPHTYIIGSSTDKAKQPNRYDDRPRYPTGTSGSFDLKDFAGYVNIPARGKIKLTDKEELVDGKAYTVANVEVTVTNMTDKLEYPLQGTILVSADTGSPYKMDLEYTELPKDTKQQTVEVIFDRTDSCRINCISILQKGKFLFYNYTIKSKYLFKY